MTVMAHDRRRGLGNPLAPLTVRVSDEHRAYLALRAELDDVAASDVLRRLIDQAIDAEPPVHQDIGEGYEALEEQHAIPLRALLGGIDLDGVPELAARLRDDA